MPRLQQFRALQDAGYEVPWNTAITAVSDATEDTLAKLLRERKSASPYDIDGLVIGRALVKPAAIEMRNGEAVIPKDMIAFKMPLDEQQARTTVRDVEWNCSRFNVYAPRLVIEPVRIGGALITYITGHNAKFMVENGLGVGAKITVLRSGDVIPIVYQVHAKVAVELPSDVWDATHTNVLATEASDRQRAAHLENALKVLEVDGAGPAAAAALVDASITTIEEILHTPEDILADILGPGKGPQLLTRLKAAIRKAPIHTLILASQDVPKGAGNAKLQKVIQTYPNWDKWTAEHKPPANWSATTWEEFCDVWVGIKEEIEGWKDAIGQDMVEVAASVVTVAKTVAKKSAASGGGVCMTGFRDKELAAASEAAGYTADDTVKKSTKFLIIPNDEDPETISTGKAVKARENGARILRASEWKKYLQDK
jgi:DNA ligase (NAD+)